MFSFSVSVFRLTEVGVQSLSFTDLLIDDHILLISQVQNEVEFILVLENTDQDFLNSRTWVGDRTSVN